MNEQEQAVYHLGKQTEEIATMSALTEPFTHKISDIEITVLPKIYPGGIDSELTIAAMGDVKGRAVLDLCTGTGIVAVKAALAGASRVVAVDLNPEAVKNVQANVDRFSLSQIDIREGSLFDPVKNEAFDVIAINPPYTGKKPANTTEICFWDEDNNTTRQFFEQYRQYLNPGGKAYLAWADFSSVELIEDFAQTNNVRLELVQSKKTSSGLATFLVYELISKD